MKLDELLRITPGAHNVLLIKETAQSCERIGAALIALAIADEPA